MKTILLLLAVVACSGPAVAQPETVNDPPCWDTECLHQAFNYKFCDPATGTYIQKCTTDPNNEPGLNPVKRALPLILCPDFSNLDPKYTTVRYGTLSDPLNPGSPITVDIFHNEKMLEELQRAAKRWNDLCPKRDPDAAHDGCCLNVRWMTRLDEMGKFPFAIANTRLGEQDGTCATDCAGAFIVLNQDPRYLDPDDDGIPRNFLFTEPPAAFEPYLDPDEYHYFSAYSVLLHELGHWLGFNHVDAKDSYGKACDPSPERSVMERGAVDWNRVEWDLTYMDICMFKKLYCCESRRQGSGVEQEATASAVAFTTYPNAVTLRLPSGSSLQHGGIVRLVDPRGTVVKHVHVGDAGDVSIDLSGVPEGMYMLTLSDGHDTHGEKIVVRR